jgi:hypothetical protein
VASAGTAAKFAPGTLVKRGRCFTRAETLAFIDQLKHYRDRRDIQKNRDRVMRTVREIKRLEHVLNLDTLRACGLAYPYKLET